jgi:hypothetical protein
MYKTKYFTLIRYCNIILQKNKKKKIYTYIKIKLLQKIFIPKISLRYLFVIRAITE